MGELNKLIKSNLKNDGMKRTFGKVIVVNKDEDKATVELKEFNNAQIELLNKTGEILSENDNVWIHYWTSVNTGYIAIRNGISVTKGGTGGEPEFLIENAPILLENQAEVYLKAKEVVNIDTKGLNRVVYGDNHNPIIVQGNLAFPMTNIKNNVTMTGTGGAVGFLYNIPPELVSQEMYFSNLVKMPNRPSTSMNNNEITEHYVKGVTIKLFISEFQRTITPQQVFQIKLGLGVIAQGEDIDTKEKITCIMTSLTETYNLDEFGTFGMFVAYENIKSSEILTNQLLKNNDIEKYFPYGGCCQNPKLIGNDANQGSALRWIMYKKNGEIFKHGLFSVASKYWIGDFAFGSQEEYDYATGVTAKGTITPSLSR